MAKIVAVHGIGQQLEGIETLKTLWLPRLRDGIALAGGPRLADDDLICAFYGYLFRPKGKALDVLYEPEDVKTDWEHELLLAWWNEAARLQKSVTGPGVHGKARVPRLVEGALAGLSRSKFFVSLSERAMIGDLKQVYAYVHDDTVRLAAQARATACIGPDTRVLIGHSLGSVVAYEVACTLPEGSIEMLVTLGSPLGIPNLIFDRLRPAPTNGRGVWPRGVKRWTNIAALGDIVALEKRLRPSFGDRVIDEPVDNGATAHNVLPYLTAVETGRAIAAGLVH